MHVHDGMALSGEKADLASVPFENGATARCRRQQYRRIHFRFHTGTLQRSSYGLALSGEIGVWRKILQRAAAADPEMTAK
jgi:hypothetical protein